MWLPATDLTMGGCVLWHFGTTPSLGSSIVFLSRGADHCCSLASSPSPEASPSLDPAPPSPPAGSLSGDVIWLSQNSSPSPQASPSPTSESDTLSRDVRAEPSPSPMQQETSEQAEGPGFDDAVGNEVEHSSSSDGGGMITLRVITFTNANCNGEPASDTGTISPFTGVPISTSCVTNSALGIAAAYCDVSDSSDPRYKGNVHSNENCTSSSFLYAFDNAADGSCISNGDAADPRSWRFYCAGGLSTASASPSPFASPSAGDDYNDDFCDPCGCLSVPSPWTSAGFSPTYIGPNQFNISEEGCYANSGNGPPEWKLECEYANNTACNSGHCQRQNYPMWLPATDLTMGGCVLWHFGTTPSLGSSIVFSVSWGRSLLQPGIFSVAGGLAISRAITISN